MAPSRSAGADRHRSGAVRPRRRPGAVVLALAMLVLAACQRIPDPGPLDTLPVDFVAPPAASVEVGIPYGPDPEHLLDVHHPASAAPAPVIVWLHHGGWVGGSRAEVPELVLRQIDRGGWAVVSADFRRMRWEGDRYVNTHPAPSEDVDRLVRWLRVHGPDRGLDPDHIVLAGASSGAHLAALAGTAPGLHVDPTLPPELVAADPSVSGVIVGSGSLDLRYQVQAGGTEAGMARTYLRCQAVPCDLAFVETASPLHQVRPDSAPAYVAAGSLDEYVPPVHHAGPYTAALRGAVAERDAAAGHPSVWYDLVETSGHNLDHTTINVTYLERWLDLVAAGTWSAGA